MFKFGCLADIVYSPCGAAKQAGVVRRGLRCGRACHNIRGAYLTGAWRRLRFWGERPSPVLIQWQRSLPYKSSPYKLLPPQNTTLVSLACTISYQLDLQHNHTPLYYFLRLYWPQFASLQLLLPSFLRRSTVLAFQFLFITSRCAATARLLTTT